MKKLRPLDQLKEELVRGHAGYVRIVAKLTRRRKADVQEALQDVVCRLLATLSERPGAYSRIVAWRPYIVRAIVNDLKDKRRRVAHRRRTCVLFGELDSDGRKKVLTVPDGGLIPEAALETMERNAKLWEEVAKLSPRQSEAVKRWAHGATFDEIATELRIRPSTVRELLSRGIRRLRKEPRIRQLAA